MKKSVERYMLWRSGITALEAVGLIGLNPKLTSRKVWESKVAARELPKTILEASPRGAAADLHYEQTRERLEAFRMRRHPSMRFAITTGGLAVFPPRFRHKHLKDPDVGFAQKLVRFVNLADSPKGWGKPGTAEVPPDVFAEAQWDLGVTQRAEMDLGVLFVSASDVTLTRYAVKAVPEMFATLYEVAEHFMAENVLQLDPPGEQQQLVQFPDEATVKKPRKKARRKLR